MKEKLAVSTHSRGKVLNAAAAVFEPKSARATNAITETATTKQPNHETVTDEVTPGLDQGSIIPLGTGNSTRAKHGDDASSDLLKGASSSTNVTDKPNTTHRHSSIKKAVSDLVRCSVL